MQRFILDLTPDAGYQLLDVETDEYVELGYEHGEQWNECFAFLACHYPEDSVYYDVETAERVLEAEQFRAKLYVAMAYSRPWEAAAVA